MADYCADKEGFDLSKILTKSRAIELFEKRQIIARHLRRLGYSYPVIGITLGRDPCTVQNMLKDGMRERRKQSSRQRYDRKKTKAGARSNLARYIKGKKEG